MSSGVENAGMVDRDLEEKPAVLAGMTGAAATGVRAVIGIMEAVG